MKIAALSLGGLLVALASVAQPPTPAAGPPATAAKPTAAPEAAMETSPAEGSEPLRLTLTEALRRAVAANPGLGAARLEVAAARAQKDLTVAAVLPHFQATGNLLRNTVESAFDFNGNRVILLPRNDWNYKLTVTQPIYAGNRDRKALAQARLGIDSAASQAEGAEEQLLLAVVSDYLAMVEGEDLLGVERRNLALTEERRKLAQNLFEAGETTRLDTLRAEADIKAAQRRVTEARRARDEAESRLRVDLALERPIAVSEPGQVLPPLGDEPTLAAAALRERPEVVEAQLALATARLEVDKQTGAYLPVLSAEGDFLSQRSSFPADRYGQLALKLTVPIWQGGETGARVALAKDRLRQAELPPRRRAPHRAGGGAPRLRRPFERRGRHLGLARDQLAASQAEYDQAADLYRAQEITTLDAEAAETSLAEARRAVATGTLDRQLAVLRVWAAAGMLKKTVLEEVSR